MTAKYAPRVKERTLTAGLGPYQLSGAATGYQGFGAAGLAGVADTVFYCCTNEVDWEVGEGSVDDTGTPHVMTRLLVMASSNNHAEVDWAAGEKEIFCVFPYRLLNAVRGGSGQRADTFGSFDGGMNLSSINGFYTLGLGHDLRIGTDAEFCTAVGQNHRITAGGVLHACALGDGARVGFGNALAVATGRRMEPGDLQEALYFRGHETGDATEQAVPDTRLSRPISAYQNATLACTVDVVARKTSPPLEHGDSKWFRIEAAISVKAGVATFVATPSAPVVVAASTAATAWTARIDLTAPDTCIYVKGEAGKTIQWGIRIRCVELASAPFT